MDAKVVGMEMHWKRFAAHTEDGAIFTSTKKEDVSQVYIELECNDCGHRMVLRFGEAYPGGCFGIEQWRER